MIARLSTALFFLFFALSSLFHLPVGGVVLGVVALIAGIAVAAGA